MKKIPFIFALIFFAHTLLAQSQNSSCQYMIDLVNIKDDKVDVSLIPPKNHLKKAKFIMPKLVPGYYDAMDFGQYISDFAVLDKTGKEMVIEKLDKNSWMIPDLENVAKISYRVADGWDSLLQNTGGAKSPGSTFIKDSLFVINYNSLVGYFEEMKDVPYKISIRKNKDFYASSALKYIHKNDSVDIVSANNYRKLVDAPVIYCVPDTTWITVGNAKILVSFYSREERHHSKVLASKIAAILKNQQAYLGGKLPVTEYAFLIFMRLSGYGDLWLMDWNIPILPFVCMDQKSIDNLPTALMAVASHEFFHIVTPLNIHSKEIQHYDFLNPVLSKHLWLYEGMTEYATIHMPVKQKMISMEEFIQKVADKIHGMGAFDNKLSFTEISTNAMTRQDQYMNFYQKGPLLGLCLDIRLRELSKGKMGTQELMLRLMKKYGKEKAFNDDELFDVITALTFPEIRTFFKEYIEEGNAMPLKEHLAKVGFEYNDTTQNVRLIANPTATQLALRKAWIGQ